jgi:hypothetical protein
MTTMETGESAALLRKLAMPFVGNCPHLGLQKSIIAAFEEGIKKDFAKFERNVLFVGAFELPVVPDASEETALLDNLKLINLPSRYEAETMKPGTPIHSVPTNLNAFPLTEAVGAGKHLANYTLLTMIAAQQLEYLRKSGFVGKGWKVLVEIHYYRKRQTVGRDKFHKDTLGQTLFVNLNYDTDVEIPGPEYILNPAVVQEHEAQIELSLPNKFLADLRWVRSQLGAPQEINIASIKPNQFVAFVDEAIHHMSPQLGGRTVKGHELAAFLAKTYGPDKLQDVSAARKVFHEECSGVGGFFRSMTNTEKPFSSFLKAIPAEDAGTWFNLVELAETPGAEINRFNLLNAGMGHNLINTLLAENWPEYQNVSIPSATEVPLAGAPLKRQASDDALNRRVPPATTGDRRFFRNWVRIVKA